jgi:lipid-binding SYLF domain-containing protein
MRINLSKSIALGLFCLFISVAIALAAETASRGTMGSAQDRIESRQDAEEAVDKAAKLVADMSGATDSNKKIPDAIMKNAQAIVIVPNVIKAGLVAGGRYGQGVLLTRNQDQWSNPVIVSLGGASLGAQIGVESSDMVMIFQNPQAVWNLLQDSDFTLGVDASVAAGSAGAKAKAMATEADIVSYQKTEGLFVGVALTGGVIDVDEEATKAYYQMDDKSADAYFGDNEEQISRQFLNADQKDTGIDAPQSAKALQNALKKYPKG